MKKNKKAILLSLLTMLSLTGCRLKKEEVKTEEYKIVDVYISNNKDVIRSHESTMPSYYTDDNIQELIDSGYNLEGNKYIKRIYTLAPSSYTLEDGTIIETPNGRIPDGYDFNGTHLIKRDSKDTFTMVGEYAYLKVDSELYDGYKDDKSKKDNIEIYQKVLVLSTNGEYAEVLTEDNKGYILLDNLEYLPKDYIELDLSDQIVKVYNDNVLVFQANTITGKPSTPTDIGYTEILEKTYNRYLVGDDYKIWVNYFFSFNYNGEGYHDASWQKSFEKDAYIYRGSHGCCNMNLDDVEEMDKYIEVGTKNLVHN